MDQETTSPEYEGWALIEVMGHTKTAGMITEVCIGGAKMLRVDTPKPADEEKTLLTQYFSGSSIFSVTPCSESAARKLIKSNHWNLPAPVLLALEKERQEESPQLIENGDEYHD